MEETKAQGGPGASGLGPPGKSGARERSWSLHPAPWDEKPWSVGLVPVPCATVCTRVYAHTHTCTLAWHAQGRTPTPEPVSTGPVHRAPTSAHTTSVRSPTHAHSHANARSREHSGRVRTEWIDPTEGNGLRQTHSPHTAPWGLQEQPLPCGFCERDPCPGTPETGAGGTGGVSISDTSAPGLPARGHGPGQHHSESSIPQGTGFCRPGPRRTPASPRPTLQPSGLCRKGPTGC